ncbi:hypothetical protein ES703_89246 [subsurface metagenome]
MSSFKLEPADILINVNDRNDPYSIIKRWALGSPYEHVFMYMGKVGILVNRQQRKILRFPMLFESNGRGVVIQSLSNRYGQKVVVMRLKSEHDRRRIPPVLEEAIKLASVPQAFYDYSVIVWHIIPKLIYQKLGINPPLRYQRDERMICSEAVYEVFHRAKLVDILLPYCTPPLPGDFVTDSTLLEWKWWGILSEDLVSLEGHTKE